MIGQKAAQDSKITPAEVIGIMERAGTVDDIEAALAVAQEFMQHNGIQAKDLSQWDGLRMLSYIYQAGRMQGIREERNRRTA